MLTSIDVEGANCLFCLNSAKEALLANPKVHVVHVDAESECFQVEHDLPDAGELKVILDRSLRGWAVASNGEVKMVPTSSALATGCALHPAGFPSGAALPETFQP